MICRRLHAVTPVLRRRRFVPPALLPGRAVDDFSHGVGLPSVLCGFPDHQNQHRSQRGPQVVRPVTDTTRAGQVVTPDRFVSMCRRCSIDLDDVLAGPIGSRPHVNLDVGIVPEPGRANRRRTSERLAQVAVFSPARCFTRPRRFVPVGVTGRRRSYSDKPSSLVNMTARASRNRDQRSSLRSDTFHHLSPATVVIVDSRHPATTPCLPRASIQ